MRRSPDGLFVRTDIWREGKYLDLWSVPHFLSGVALALAMHFFGFAALPTYIIGFLLLVAYEMFEALVKIEETRMNRILDVVVGMVSFVPALSLAPLLSDAQALAAFAVVGGTDAALSLLGWQASQKAAVLEAKVRAELEERKEKMQARGARFKEKMHERRLRWGKRRRMFKRRVL